MNWAVTRHKTNKLNSVGSHTNNQQWEREIKKTIPSTSTSERIQYLVINLTKEVEDLHSENC